MNTVLRCLIVDDKPLALDILTDYIRRVEGLDLLIATTDPVAALNRVATDPVDLIFLDIQMPQLSGLQFLSALAGRAGVILTTAYAEYALEGFEHDVIDYLLKPISFERFYRAVQKARSRTGIDRKSEPRPYLFVRTEHKLQRVTLAELRYVAGMQNYVVIHTNGEKVIAKQTISSLVDWLPAASFIRVHKSFIVALSHIVAVERNRILMETVTGQVVIPIGEAYRENFVRAITGH